MTPFILTVFIAVSFCHIDNVFSTTVGKSNDTNISRIAKSICGYNTFCRTENRSVPEGFYSCCAECSCSDDCFLANQCCPDARIKNIDTEMKCRYQYEYFDYHRNIYSETPYTTYFIVDTCSESHDENIIDGCLNPKALEDHVLVSEQISMKIYKNEKCAQCNGVQNYEKWTALILCSYNDALLDLEQRDGFILKHCSVVSKPPKTSEDVFDFMKCSPEAVDVCNVTGEWDFYDEDIERGCRLYNMMFRSENLSPTNILKSYTIYKNPYCYMCNKKNSTVINPTCLQDVDTSRDSPLEMVPFISILNIIEPQPTEEKKCRIDEKEDPFTGRCTHLFCPFGETAVNGICYQTMHDTLVSLQTIYTLSVTSSKTGVQDSTLNKAVFKTLIEDIDSKFSRTGCHLCNLIMFSGNFFLIRARPNGLCPMSKILKVLEYISDMKVSKDELMIEFKQTNNYSMQSTAASRSLVIEGLNTLHTFKKRTCMKGVHLSTKFGCERVEFSVKDLVDAGLTDTSLENLLRVSDPFEFNGEAVESYLVCLSDYERIVSAAPFFGKDVSLYVFSLLLILKTCI